ncbi:MAG TPA: hypothetical protein VFG83_19450 [Kofleriaceae bacterium]|nr:hypothetical protein [Kofleriaceae bacterium]
MSSALPERVEIGDLALEIAKRGDDIVVHWHGKSNQRNPRQHLHGFFHSLVGATLPQRVVEFHFEDIDHFNSATILAIVELARDLDRCGGIFRCVYDAGQRWQKLTFEALGRLDVPIAVIGRAVTSPGAR